MRNPRIYVAYCPRAGLDCALAYVATQRDVYGWFTGRGEDGETRSAYFVLEDYYTRGVPRYVEVAAADLHSDWTTDEERCHEMAALQDAFMHEWLAYRALAEDAADFEAYARGDLAAGAVAPRYERLAHLAKDAPTWTFYSPTFDRGVLEFLERCWPLAQGAEARALTRVKKERGAGATIG